MAQTFGDAFTCRKAAAMATILVVDDDPDVRDALSVALPFQWEAATVLTVADGDAVLRTLYDDDPDIVILDVSLPGLSGFEVLRQIRRVSDIPVILLSARGEEKDQVQGLALGADDYIVKPFSALALMARIRAVLRRTELASPSRVSPDFVEGPLTISYQTRRVSVHGQPIHLTPVEFKLLYHLARNAGHLLPHETLLNRVWGPDALRTPDHLRVYVSRLRTKIEQAGGPDCIETERGVGYRFVRSAADDGPTEASRWPETPAGPVNETLQNSDHQRDRTDAGGDCALLKYTC
jgi:two-component system KDP operon response regulator KdpE